jgi:beta-xylosidase
MSQQHTQALWVADRGDGTYQNPVLFADYSDPDVIRVGDDFYMIASSFNCAPGIPVLHSKDLVNWRIVNHVFDRLPFPAYDKPAHGCGAWAPSIRYHDNKFWVFFCTPDEGVFMSNTTDPAGDWSPLHQVKAVTGWIDPCPFWDDDGQAYLVHAFANSRVGIKSVLHICRMKPDGTELLDVGRFIFDGTDNQPTIEGPKMHKRDGYYTIFAPAGGVAPGWQTVLRSKDIYGPYEDRIVMTQGNTEINGPHQGAWLELESGESWFVHFQDRGAYGRIIHLQPVEWVDGWPVIGEDKDGDGIGEPVATWEKPNVGKSYPVGVPQTSDEFDSKKLGLQWQWHANPKPEWMSLTENEGNLRLYAMPAPADADLWYVPNLLLQKFPAPAFTVTTQLIFQPEVAEERAGLVVMGFDYAYVALHSTGNGLQRVQGECTNANTVPSRQEVAGTNLAGESVYLRVSVEEGALCQFSYSEDGQTFTPIGREFRAREGHWIGAKIGLFCINPNQESGRQEPGRGFVDVAWFHFDE